jgi:hypothetical protein
MTVLDAPVFLVLRCRTCISYATMPEVHQIIYSPPLWNSRLACSKIADWV